MSNKSGHTLPAGIIQVDPPQINFNNVQQGVIQYVTVNIKNVDSRVRVFRLKGPKGKFFTVRGYQNTKLFPGITTSFEVIFAGDKLETERKCVDKILLQSDIGDYELLLSATISSSDVVIDGDLNFGALPSETKATKRFQLTNRGANPTPFKLEWDKSLPIVLEPTSGTLAAAGSQGSSIEITATLSVGDVMGASGEIALVLSDNDSRRVFYTATVVRQSFEIMDFTGLILDELEFGSAYFGETIEKKFEVFNNGPLATKFLMSYGTASELKSQVQDAAAAGAQADQSDLYAGFVMAARMKTKARESGDNPFTVTPVSGDIPAYSKREFVVKFHPAEKEKTKGFMGQPPRVETNSRYFEHLVLLEMIGVTAKLKLPIKGRGMPHGIRILPPILNFGEVPTYSYADQLVSLANANPILDMGFEVDTRGSPYFDVTPPTGLLMAGQSVQLVARYQPRALGQHNKKLPIRLSSSTGLTVAFISMSLVGSSTHLGPKMPPVGGINKLPKDFEKPYRFIDPEQVKESLRQQVKNKRSSSASKFLGRPDIANAFMDIPENGNKYALSKTDFVAMKEHQEKYTAATRTQRLSKSCKARSGRVEDDDINLGLGSKSGLVPPEPILPKSVDPLWKVEGNKEARPRHRRVLSDEDIQAGPTTFKPRPETEAERVACARELTDDQISKLIVGPKTLAYGSISVGATATRYLCVTNTLDAPIHVVLDLKTVQELRTSPNSSQVIASGQTARFPLTLIGKDVRSINQHLEFCINSSHMLGVDVTATVSPVSLDVSAEELHFEFSIDNWEPYVDKNIILDNPNKFPVEFETEIKNSVFSVAPQSGCVKPESSTELVVRWAPTQDSPRGVHTGHMLLKLVGGEAPKRVYLRAELPEGMLRFKERILDAGIVPVGVQQTLTVQLRNAGQRDTAFRVLPNPLITVMPARAKILADATVDIDVNFICNDVMMLNTTLEMDVRGGSVIKLPLKAEAIIPIVEIKEEQFSFGSSYTGGVQRLPINLKNTTAVPARVSLDFSKHPEYDVTISKDAWSPNEYESCPLTRIGPGEGLRPSSRRVSTQITSFGRMSNGRRSGSLLPPGCGPKFQVLLNPKKSMALMLEYRPISAGNHSFDLAFHTLTASEKHSRVVQRPVTAEAVAPRIVLSATEHDFGSCIVIRSNQTKLPYKQSLSVTNHDTQPLTVVFGASSSKETGTKSDQGAGVFAVDPPHVNLQPGEGMEVYLRFTPRDSRSYTASIPVYLLDGEVSPPVPSMDLVKLEPYFRIETRGSGCHPRLTFNVREVVLPPVPLGIRSEATFYVINNGYDNLELEFRLPPDEAHLPLSLEFPDGRLIGLAKGKLPVVVSFKHQKPLSFTAAIDFLDEDGKRYSVPVTGTTDNCVLTHHSFLRCNAGSLMHKVEDKAPITLLDSMYNLPDPIATLGPTYSLTAICRFLNLTSMGRGEPIVQLVTQLAASRGKLLVDIVEAVAGKPMAGVGNKLSTNKKEAAKQLLAQFDSALVFLKSHGALLNAVKPEMLLDLEDFERILAEKEVAAKTPEDEAALDMWGEMAEEFQRISIQAWNSVILQVFKVFVLARVTLKSFRNLPGLDRLPQGSLQPETAILGSNIYSVAEGILLSWLTAHYVREFPKIAIRISNFDSDLKDGLALFSLLSGYWPAVGRRRGAMKTSVTSERDIQENGEVLARLIQDLGLPWELSPSDLLNPDPCEMLVLVLYLYQTLPQFVPKTVIQFSCKLGETLVKDLELTNPSKKLISYAARLEGHKDFALDGHVFTIESKGSIKLPIRCTPSSSMPQEARIVLMSRKESGANAATLVFSLRSAVNVRAPLKRIRTEGPLYEMQQFEFTVNNPFPADCEFFISLMHEPAEPLPPPKTDDDKDKRRRSTITQEKPPPVPSPTDMLLAAQAATAVSNTSRVFPAAFGLDKQRLRLKQGGQEKIKGFFLPLIMGMQYCTVCLKDKEYGEFCYELVGEVSLPSPFLETKGFVSVEGSQMYDVAIPFSNHQLEAAKRTFLERHPLAKEKDQMALLKTDVFKNDITYQILQSNSLVHCNDTLVLTPNPTTIAAASEPGLPPGQQAPPVESNMLRLSLKPVGTGIYPVRILMASPIDTRILDVQLTAQQLTQFFSLDFACAARQAITQDVPLVNTSDSMMVVSAQISGSRYFSGPREMSVPPASTSAYPLKFAPPLPGAHKGSLVLVISATGEKNTYNLSGLAGEPLAEGHIVIESVARVSTQRRIAVPCFTGQSEEYTVMSDLSCVVGPDKVKVHPGAGSAYTMTACPHRSGIYVGMISFIAEDGQSCWFGVEVRASEPPEVGMIEVEAQVRGAVEVTVMLINPMGKSIEVSARYSDPALIGPRSFTLPASEPGDYAVFRFYFAPLVAGTFQGTVVLMNEEVGEYVYLVKGTAYPAGPEELPALTAVLGKKASTKLPFENLLEYGANVTATSSDPSVFRVIPSEAYIEPFGEVEFEVEYIPHELTPPGEPNRAVITLDSPRLGTYVYHASGNGVRPSVLAPMHVSAQLGQISSEMLTWLNPFDTLAQVTITLSPGLNTPSGVFDLGQRKEGPQSVAARTALAIPVVFRPDSLTLANADVEVVANGVSWRYPVIGMAEANMKDSVFKYKCKARHVIEEVMEVVLTGLHAVSPEDEFTSELLLPAEHRSVLAGTLSVTPLEGGSSLRLAGPADPLRYRLRFAPQRVMSASADFLVVKSTGGRWKFEIQLSASEPDIDGVIMIEAAMSQKVNHPIFLYSSGNAPQPFTASFTPDSPLNFSVVPAKGLLPVRALEPVENEEAAVTVSYLCRDFGKILKGRLIVVTDDMQYGFEVRGQVPNYVPPTPAQFQKSIDNDLPENVKAKLDAAHSRNYITRNIHSLPRPPYKS